MIKVEQDNKKALKAGLWYTASNFLLKGMAFITTPIFTRMLTKGEFGSYHNYASWLSIVAVVVTLDMQSSVARARYDFEEDFDSYLSSVIFLGTLITACFYGVVLLFPGFFSALLGIDMVYIHIMFLNVLLSPALSIMQSRNRILQKYKSFVIVSILMTCSSTGLAVFLIFRLQDRLFAKIVGESVPLIFAYAVAYVLMMARGKKLINLRYWKYAVLFSAPIVPHLLSNTLLNHSDKVMITRMVGAEANAIYSLAYSCGMIVSVLSTSMNRAWVPWLFDRMYEKKYQMIRRISKLYLLVFILMVEGTILLAPELMLILGGKSYEEARYVVPPIMLGYGMKFAYTFYVNMEQYAKKTAFISVGTILAALANIGLNYIFIPIFGYLAAGYTTLAGFFLLLLLHFIFSRRLQVTYMYDNRFLFTMMGLMTLLGLLSQLLYLNTLLRYGVILLTGAIGLFLLIKLYRQYRLKGEK